MSKSTRRKHSHIPEVGSLVVLPVLKLIASEQVELHSNILKRKFTGRFSASLNKSALIEDSSTNNADQIWYCFSLNEYHVFW